MIGIYQKKSGETVYYVNAVNYRFSLPKLDANGKVIQATNPATGNPIYRTDGNPEIIEYPVEFTPWKSRFSEEGYWSVFVVDKNTPKQIADELKKDAADPKTRILTEAEFIAQTNPDLATFQKQESEKDVRISQQEAEIAELRAKLAGVSKAKPGPKPKKDSESTETTEA